MLNSNCRHFFWFDTTPTGHYEKQWLFLMPGENAPLKAQYMANYIIQYDSNTGQAHYLKNRDGCQDISLGKMTEILYDARINLRSVKDAMGFNGFAEKRGTTLNKIQSRAETIRDMNLCQEVVLPKDRETSGGYSISFSMEKKKPSLASNLTEIAPSRKSSLQSPIPDMVFEINRAYAESTKLRVTKNHWSSEMDK